jgi:hypothetical protein
MIFWSIQVTIISIIFIFLVHHLLMFFKTNLTVPKVKDLVNVPRKKYDDIYQTINSPASQKPTNDIIYKDSLLPKQHPDISEMKNDLKNFLKNQMHSHKSNNITSATNIDDLQNNNYASYGM